MSNTGFLSVHDSHASDARRHNTLLAFGFVVYAQRERNTWIFNATQGNI